MRSKLAPVSLLLTLITPTLGAQQESQPTAFPTELYGVYDLGDGDRLFVVAADGRPALGLPGGRVRGLAADTAGGFRYGPSLGVGEPLGGRLSFSPPGGSSPLTVTWTTADGERRHGARLPIRQQQVRFENGGVRLAGTLYMPATAPPHPAIVLTHGSGPAAREPGFYEHLFASLGLAVLSYDKRGTGESDGADWRAPFADYAADALAAVRFLGQRPEIAADRIGLHGPSQGGWVAPLAASMSDDVAFVIIRSGNAISPRRQDSFLVERRMRHLTELSDPQIAAALDYLDLRMDRVVGRIGQAEFRRALKAKRKTDWGRYIGDGLPDGEFWRPNADYDPEPALRRLRCPLLVLLGAADNYTPAEENRRLFQRILADSGHPDYAVHVFPRANHGLFETETGRPLEQELPQLERLAPGYLETMTDWLVGRGFAGTTGQGA